METVASEMLPALTPAGRFTKVSFTVSPSSSSASSAASKVKVLEVSVGPKVTLAGTTE